MRTEVSLEPANVLRIEGLGDGWCDKDFVMLFACFQLLSDCVEKEELFTGHVDWEHTEEMKQARARLGALYDWWQQRKDRNSTADDMDETLYADDTTHLQELVELRRFLWT